MEVAIQQHPSQESLPLPFRLHSSCLHMEVKFGSKTKNLVSYVKNKFFRTDSHIEQMTWNASGAGISKAIAYAEIIKRQSTTNLEEYVQIGYNNNDKLPSFNKSKMNKNIPSICIVLSKVPLMKCDEKES